MDLNINANILSDNPFTVDGSQPQGISDSIFAFSADGKYIAFDSEASNLTPEDTDVNNEVFRTLNEVR